MSQVRLDGADDVVHAFVAFVVGVIHAAGDLRLRETRIEVGEIAVVDERPAVVAVADDEDVVALLVRQDGGAGNAEGGDRLQPLDRDTDEGAVDQWPIDRFAGLRRAKRRVGNFRPNRDGIGGRRPT